MTARPLRILHISDPHLHASREACMRGVNTDASLLACLEHAFADPHKPDLVLATGDLVQDETRQGYERFRELLGKPGMPVHCLPGNHDSIEAMQAVLSDAPFRLCGIGDYPPWRLVILNSRTAGDDGGFIATQELENLQQALGTHREGHVLIALHHQPVPMGSRWLDTVGLRNADAFLAIVDRCPQVRAIVWGHVHQASDRLRNGVRLISTPSTCAQFLPEADNFALDTRPPGYRWLDLRPDGTIGTSVVWVG
ncbi:MAG: metallophosphoesterase [Gammaproteobacteria bacterium]|nr:metallophosphoesterase [Gammaproteobacteria bacterium]